MNTEQTTLSNSFLTELNDAQRKAVTAPLGVQLIVAGAGSGKTRVITARIAYLLSHYQVPSSAVLALTFTNKAGAEMKERIKKYLPHSTLPFVGTFHSYCVKLLRQYSSFLPFSDFSIIDTEDQRSILKKIMENYGIDKHITPSKMQGLISLSKNHLPGHQSDMPVTPFFNEVFAAYEREKNKSHAYDFDDLLTVTLDLLKKNPEITAQLQRKISHLLVDEYQDTNQIQHEFLKTLAFNNKTMVLQSVCAVGDQDQSIYSWRGAQADNMQKFCTDFAPVQTITIDQNYRSVKPILDAANEVISHNRGRIEKKLWSAKHASNRLMSLYCQSGNQEAQAITQAIQLARQKIALNNIAILYRTHHQSRAIEEAFMLAGISYTIIGGIRFYERKEIKDILAYAKLLINRFDRTSFFRIINIPGRGIGDKCIDIAQATWDTHPEWHCVELLYYLKDHHEFNKTQKLGFSHLYELLSLPYLQKASSAIFDTIIHQIDYSSYLRKNYTDKELTNKLENVQELLTAVRSFEQEHPAAELADFLEHVMLMQEHTEPDESKPVQQVKMMTLHGAKGLEFDFIIMPGLEEQLFPSARAMSTNAEMEEERRLMYVGLTRAREYVLLTNSELRTTYGSSTYQQISRFIQEIPSTLIAMHDTRQESTFARNQKLAQWLGTNIVPTIQTFNNLSSQNPIVHKTASRPSLIAKPVQTHITKRAPWLVRMPVKHDSFGVGLIQEIEHKGNDEYFLTISFKSGVKKLSSRFVSRS
jgi:DNA helicase-2/ATP-dependent DNA helicase PcrA